MEVDGTHNGNTMAGIGFLLREWVNQKGVGQWFIIYAYSALIFSGPWLISNLSLGALSIFAIASLQEIEVRIFTVIIVYTYCFSLITTGVIQLGTTRYISDQLFMSRDEKVIPAFIGSLVVTSVMQTMTGAIALYFIDMAIVFKVATLGLYVTVSMIWIEMLFLSSTKEYNAILLSFLIGYLSSFLLALGFGILFKLEGMIIGFLCGQVILFTLLSYRILSEYSFRMNLDFEFLSFLKKYPSLAFIGLFYNGAIWVDKIIFWYSHDGLHIHSYFYTHFPYDSAMFISYMSIIPTLAIFMLRIETIFYIKYKNYYGAILQRAPLDQIIKRKQEMLDTLKDAAWSVMLFQGSVSLGVFILMPYIVALFGIDPDQTPVFRVAVIGVFFHACLLVLLILFLYFDFRGFTLFLSFMFLVTNSGLSILSIYLGKEWHGFGYTIACLTTLIAGFALFMNRMNNLEYLTFMRQRIN